MAAVSRRRALLPLSLLVAISTTAPAQTAAPAPSGATAAWTLKTKGDIRWQQVTPAGALLVSTDAALAGVDIERGQAMWEKPELGGLPADSVRIVEGSLLMEAARPGLWLVFDPVTGAVVFDSRRLNLAQIVPRLVRRAAHRPRRQPGATRAAVSVARQDRPHLRGLRRPAHGLPPRRRSGPVVQAPDDRGLGARHRAAPQRDHHPPGITARQSGDGQRAHRERCRADGAER